MMMRIIVDRSHGCCCDNKRITFNAAPTLPHRHKQQNASASDSFVRRYSNLWRAFVEHWLVVEQRGLVWPHEATRHGMSSKLGNSSIKWLSVEERRQRAQNDGYAQLPPPLSTFSSPLSPSSTNELKQGGSHGSSPRKYFLLTYESLVREPEVAVLGVLAWAKSAALLAGSSSSVGADGLRATKEAREAQSSLMDRARKCTSYGNVIQRAARASRSNEQLGGASLPSREFGFEYRDQRWWRVISDHSAPYYFGIYQSGSR